MYQHDDYSSKSDSDNLGLEGLEIPTHSNSDTASEELNLFASQKPASGGLNLYGTPEQPSEGYNPFTPPASGDAGAEPYQFNDPESNLNTGSAPPPEDLAKSKPISDLLNDLQNPPKTEKKTSSAEATAPEAPAYGSHTVPDEPRGSDDLQVFPKAEPETSTSGSSTMPEHSPTPPTAPAFTPSASGSAGDENIWLDVITAHPELNYLQAEIMRLVCTGKELPRARALLDRLIAQQAA